MALWTQVLLRDNALFSNMRMSNEANDNIVVPTAAAHVNVNNHEVNDLHPTEEDIEAAQGGVPRSWEPPFDPEAATEGFPWYGGCDSVSYIFIIIAFAFLSAGISLTVVTALSSEKVVDFNVPKQVWLLGPLLFLVGLILSSKTISSARGRIYTLRKQAYRREVEELARTATTLSLYNYIRTTYNLTNLPEDFRAIEQPPCYEIASAMASPVPSGRASPTTASVNEEEGAVAGDDTTATHLPSYQSAVILQVTQQLEEHALQQNNSNRLDDIAEHSSASSTLPSIAHSRQRSTENSTQLINAGSTRSSLQDEQNHRDAGDGTRTDPENVEFFLQDAFMPDSSPERTTTATTNSETSHIPYTSTQL